MEEDGIISEANNAGKRHVLKNEKYLFKILIVIFIYLLLKRIQPLKTKKKYYLSSLRFFCFISTEDGENK